MRNWTAAAVTIILAAFCIMVLSAISTERWNYVDEVAQAEITAEERLRLYRETDNTEWLVDLANFAMIEYMHPSHPQAHFRATGSNESPGLKNGISYKELMEEGET